MSTKTTNFGLIKPELTDAADITQFNTNWNIIDNTMHSLNYALNEVTNLDVPALRQEVDDLQTQVDYMITCGTDDLTEGQSQLTTGTLYLVYE